MATVIDDAILILGGDGKSDGVVYNPQSQQVVSTIDSGTFSNDCIGNQHVVNHYGKVLVLGMNNDDENLNLVEVSADGQTANSLMDFGYCI